MMKTYINDVSKYFSISEIENFQFIRIPKSLLNKKYRDLSVHAKFLYGLLLERTSLSISNNWIDSEGRVFIYYSRESVCEELNIGKDKARLIFKELREYNLIEEIRQGLGKANIIYVLKCILNEPLENKEDSNKNTQSNHCDNKKYENKYSENSKIRFHEHDFSECNYTNINYTKNNNLSIDDDHDGLMDHLFNKYELETLSNESELYKECVFLIYDILTSDNRKLERINSGFKPISAVKSIFNKLEIPHLQYVIERIKDKTDKIKNIRSYLITSLYNSFSTLEFFYSNCMNTMYAGEPDILTG